MINRKDRLRAALTAREHALPADNSAAGEGTSTERPAQLGSPGTPPAPRPLVRSGAVGAMGRSLGRITQAAEEARALVAAGDTVIELDPSSIDPSFVTDRFVAADEGFSDLVSLIRERGQQVPILVRPHPERPGRHQIAYGHRRWRAASELGRPVRAVVKDLLDEDLVVAQGQENSARTDLSYIERALFAVSLEDRGFERPLVMSALAMEKSQISRLLAIGRAVPASLATAIGPAPKTGRPRWTALVEALGREGADDILERTLARPDFRNLASDARFARVLAALTASPERARGGLVSAWKNPAGRAVVRIDQNARRTHLIVDERIEPSFGTYLIEKLPDLYEAFHARTPEGDSS